MKLKKNLSRLEIFRASPEETDSSGGDIPTRKHLTNATRQRTDMAYSCHCCIVTNILKVRM